MAIIRDMPVRLDSREALLEDRLALATQERNAYRDAADLACFQRDLAIQYIDVLQEAVEFAKDTTDRGDIAAVMEKALASTRADVMMQDQTTIQLQEQLQ